MPSFFEIGSSYRGNEELAATDEKLVKLACAGNAQAFRDLLDFHYMTIYRMAFKLCGNQHDAEDVTQMACMKLAQSIGTFKQESAFTTWLYTIVLNTVRDWRRAQVRHKASDIEDVPDIDSDAPTPEQTLSTSQEMDRVRALPEPEREIIFLVFGEGLSHREVAKIMGVAESTISWRIHEARKILNEGGRRHG